MNISDKKENVKEIKNKFQNANAFFISHNLGMQAEEITALRRSLKANKGELKVVKNTLIKRAIKDMEYEKTISDDFSGPSVVAFSYGDPVAVAKLVIDAVKSTKKDDKDKFVVKAGVLGSKKITSVEIEKLSSLPSKEELIARTVRTVAAPLTNFMNVLSAVPKNLMNVLVAYKNSKENN